VQENGKGEKESSFTEVSKKRQDRGLIPSRGCGLADGTSSDAMPDAAGGEEVTGPLDGMP
jgi:hypothetical protein